MTPLTHVYSEPHPWLVNRFWLPRCRRVGRALGVAPLIRAAQAVAYKCHSEAGPIGQVNEAILWEGLITEEAAKVRCKLVCCRVQVDEFGQLTVGKGIPVCSHARGV